MLRTHVEPVDDVTIVWHDHTIVGDRRSSIAEFSSSMLPSPPMPSLVAHPARRHQRLANRARATRTSSSSLRRTRRSCTLSVFTSPPLMSSFLHEDEHIYCEESTRRPVRYRAVFHCVDDSRLQSIRLRRMPRRGG
ncbi:hypothetical protein SCHPADRAFT_1003430 [Schizopora paradoxa]|uniref:Uncharacterized protein n=1 Tax=Schizopora paradoxa TaxID=27342 RepID=A0A0H2R3G3_9AGAM|nr:hypothetical protein SCHPADRAFT_1003430 [Schizopora paradoxa]